MQGPVQNGLIQAVGDIRFIESAPRLDTSAPAFLSREATMPVRQFHMSLENYAPSPLRVLKTLAAQWGLGAVCIKDESDRFGLKAFKALGGSYAMFRIACKMLGLDDRKTVQTDLYRPEFQEQLKQMEFVTATDGNHGKGVAWAAAKLGCRSHVYMPRGSVEARAEAIRRAGAAEVVVTDVGYDDTVRHAAKLAAENGWYLVQDTSWPGYEDIPSWIVQGYTTLIYEALDQLQGSGMGAPTHVFLQAGVGAMAGSVLGALRCTMGKRLPCVAIVEPDTAACIFESARQNDQLPHRATGSEQTIMAGLNCSEPCSLTWPILRDFSSAFFSCPDWVSERGMRILAKPQGEDNRIVSGESGAVTGGLLSLLMEMREMNELRERLGLNEHSVVLLVNTEGDTDPEGYRHILSEGGREAI
ncbi:diaminopropionate ammonia-lyase [uncultured Oscillibacter sp.]|uniref:diaminopropionate ammonia-lyase n=1 Tax=uncultured Oscillibacter sp. TaxID=876091 RepID=UPI0025D3745A|nr:diaminopropionate ammonia-lyase [uncultured Oscillibacter sp.]